MNFKLLLTNSILVLAAFFPNVKSHATFAPAPVYPDQLPNEVKAAVSLSSWLESNQITSRFDGVTQGYIDVGVQVEAKGDYKVYKDKFKISISQDPLLPPENWRLEILKLPSTIFFTDPVTKEPKAGFRGQSVFMLRAHLPEKGIPQALPLTHRIPFVVEFQACSAKLCLLPAAVKLDFAITSQAKIKARQLPPSSNIIDNAGSELKKLLGASAETLSWMALLITFSAGLLTAFTPCVYPLYPITLGIFSRWAHSHKGASPFFMSLFYCAGMVLSYASLGLATAASGAIFGSITQTPFFLIGTGLLILFSALVFEGIIDLRIFRFLQELFSSPTSENKRSTNAQLYSKSFGMGTALGLVASPCVGPVLVVLLAWLTQKLVVVNLATMATGFVLLGTFGMGMSLPFLVIGYFIFQLGTRPQLGKYTPFFKHLGTALMVAASLIFLVPGIKLLTRNSSVSASAKNYPVLQLNEWKKDRPAVIDFRADWCAACIELETETFSHPNVAKIFNSGRFAFIQVDMTEMSDENSQIRSQYEVYGLPTVLISDESGKICRNETLTGFENAAEFIQRLERAEKSCE